MTDVSRNIAELKASIEDQYLQDFVADAPTDIYFELATIIAARIIKLDKSAVDLQEKQLIDKAERAARGSIVTSLATRAYQIDANQGNELELEKLMKQVRGE